MLLPTLEIQNFAALISYLSMATLPRCLQIFRKAPGLLFNFLDVDKAHLWMAQRGGKAKIFYSVRDFKKYFSVKVLDPPFRARGP